MLSPGVPTRAQRQAKYNYSSLSRDEVHPYRAQLYRDFSNDYGVVIPDSTWRPSSPLRPLESNTERFAQKPPTPRVAVKPRIETWNRNSSTTPWEDGVANEVPYDSYLKTLTGRKKDDPTPLQSPIDLENASVDTNRGSCRTVVHCDERPNYVDPFSEISCEGLCIFSDNQYGDDFFESQLEQGTNIGNPTEEEVEHTSPRRRLTYGQSRQATERKALHRATGSRELRRTAGWVIEDHDCAPWVGRILKTCGATEIGTTGQGKCEHLPSQSTKKSRVDNKGVSDLPQVLNLSFSRHTIPSIKPRLWIKPTESENHGEQARPTTTIEKFGSIQEAVRTTQTYNCNCSWLC